MLAAVVAVAAASAAGGLEAAARAAFPGSSLVRLCKQGRIPLAALRLWGWTRPSTVGAQPGFRCFVRR